MKHNSLQHVSWLQEATRVVVKDSYPSLEIKHRTIGSVSIAHPKQIWQRFAAMVLLLHTIGIGNMWAADVQCTLSNTNIVNGTAAATGYGEKSFTDGCSQTWNAYAIKNYHSNATKSYEYIQIRAKNGSTVYYLQVPEKTGYTIKSITMVVSSASATRDGGGNNATLYFSSSNDSGTASSGASANPATAASGTGAASITIDCSSLKLSTGYITASAGIRIWGDVVVTYTSTPSCTTSIDLSNSGQINGSVNLS